MTEHHTTGSLVWVQDAGEGWVKGVVNKVLQSTLEVKTDSGALVTCKPQDAPLQNPSSRMGVEVSAASQLTLKCQGSSAHTGFRTLRLLGLACLECHFLATTMYLCRALL